MLDFDHDNLSTILTNWFTPAELRELQIREMARGMSGAKLWQVSRLHDDTFCLRRWPKIHPNVEQLVAIHGLIKHLPHNGISFVPLPRCTLTQQMFVNVKGHLWELASWLPGETLGYTSTAQMTAAMKALAQLHLAMASLQPWQYAPAPGLEKRLDILRGLRNGQLTHLDRTVRGADSSALREIALTMLTDIQDVLLSTLSALEKSASEALPLQWCLCDVHLGNLLFTEDRVTGVVDFGAAAIDSVAGDIARLVGSMAGDDSNRWRHCLKIYQELRPLSPPEIRAIALFDRAGLIASASNWLRWLFVEGREFADAVTTQSRLSHLAGRLKSLKQRGGSHFLGLS